MLDPIHQQIWKLKLFPISHDFCTEFDYFAKNGDWLINSHWLHNLYRNLSDKLSINKI